jgi:hypothetical protein
LKCLINAGRNEEAKNQSEKIKQNRINRKASIINGIDRINHTSWIWKKGERSNAPGKRSNGFRGISTRTMSVIRRQHTTNNKISSTNGGQGGKDRKVEKWV